MTNTSATTKTNPISHSCFVVNRNSDIPFHPGYDYETLPKTDILKDKKLRDAPSEATTEVKPDRPFRSFPIKPFDISKCPKSRLDQVKSFEEIRSYQSNTFLLHGLAKPNGVYSFYFEGDELDDASAIDVSPELVFNKPLVSTFLKKFQVGDNDNNTIALV